MAESSAMIDRTKYAYQSTRVTDPKTGKVRVSVGNMDAVARAMLLVTSDDLIKIAKKNGLDKYDAAKRDSVNPGQFRMQVGNALRGKVRKGEEVTIGEVVVKKLDQREPVIKEVPPGAPKKKTRAKKAA